MFYQLVYFASVAILIKVVEMQIHEEPSCNKFHFEEKVLEKLIRLEHRMEVWDEKMDEKISNFKEVQKEWIDKIEKQFSKMSEAEMKRMERTESHITRLSDADVARTDKSDKLQVSINQELLDQKTKLDEVLSNFNKQVTRLSQGVMEKQGDVNKTLAESIEKYKKEVGNLKADLSIAAVVFKAKTVADKTPSVRSMVRYTETITNVGGGYDAATGYFTVPHDGTYLFTVQICGGLQDSLGVQIVAADNVIGTVYNLDGTYNLCTPGTGVAVLSTGDKVWITCSNRGSVYEDIHRVNSFSGVLIHSGIK